MTETDQFATWRRRLAGEKFDMTQVPEPGYYRAKRRDKSGWDAVAIWNDESGVLQCNYGGKMLDEVTTIERWTWLQGQPISQELYFGVVEGKMKWPDMNEAVAALGEVEETFEGVADAFERLAITAEAEIKKGAAKDQDRADQCSDLASKLGELWKIGEKLRKEEVKPFDDGKAAVQAKFNPIFHKDTGKIVLLGRKLKELVIGPWLQAEKARLDREQAEREAAARREAEEQAKQAGASEEEAKAIAETIETPEPVRDNRPKAGGLRRASSLRTTKVAKIVDFDKALLFFKDYQPVRDLIQDLANKAVKMGNVPAGCEEDTKTTTV